MTHYERVFHFMKGAKQDCPIHPIIPDEGIRRLRAELILEEALETVKALGFNASVHPSEGRHKVILSPCAGGCDIVEVLDGCCDTHVVVTGTLIAFGIEADQPQFLVDRNNLEKLGPGHWFRDDGKLMKPEGHRKPDLIHELRLQGWEG